jgi:hypothetical protein
MMKKTTSHTHHGEYVKRVASDAATRRSEIETLFKTLFPDLICTAECQIIKLGQVDQPRLASALLSNPKLLKPLLAVCNMGKRAIAQDLGLEVDTYRPRLTAASAEAIASYLKPMLPVEISLEAIGRLDSYQFVDTAIRKSKGRWEKRVCAAFETVGLRGHKRKFQPSKDSREEFELDFAMPIEGDIEVGVDVKHIGHPSDKQKRGDEIVNKALKLWEKYPNALFFSIVKYPYPDDQEPLRARLRPTTRQFDGLYLAGDDEESLSECAHSIRKVIESKKPHLLRN